MANISAFSQAQYIGCQPPKSFLRPAKKNDNFQTLIFKLLITRASCPRTTLPNVKSSTCFQKCTRAPLESENLLNLEMTPSLSTNNPSLNHPTTEIFNPSTNLILSKSTGWARGRGLRSPERFLNLSPEIKKVSLIVVLWFRLHHLVRTTWSVQCLSLHGQDLCQGRRCHSLHLEHVLPNQGDRKLQVHDLPHRAHPDRFSVQD